MKSVFNRFLFILGFSIILISANAFAEEIEIIHLVQKYVSFSVQANSSASTDYGAWDLMINGDQYLRERQEAAVKGIARGYCTERGYVFVSVAYSTPTEDTSLDTSYSQDYAYAWSGVRHQGYTTSLSSVRCFRDSSKNEKESDKNKKDVKGSSVAGSDTSPAPASAGSATDAAAAAH